MTALLAGRYVDKQASPRVAHTYQKILTSSTVAYRRGVTALDPSTGQWVKPDGTKSTLIIYGVAETGDQDHVTGGNDANGNPIELLVESGCYLMGCPAGGLTAQNEGAVVYCLDDNNFSLTQGTASIQGILQKVLDGGAYGEVMIDPFVNQALAAATTSAGSTSSVRKARLVAATVPIYTGTGTAVLTVTATGALSAIDGKVPAINDVILFPEGATNLTAAGDAGPWLVANPGAVSVSPVFVRPSWWSHGAALVPHTVIDIGDEGTGTDPGYAGTAWVCRAAPGGTVGTTAPLLYPRQITSAVTLASGTLAAARQGLPVLHALRSTIVIQSNPATAPHASTRDWRVSALTIGATNTASIQIVAESAPGTTNASDVGQYNLTVFNGG